MEWKRLLKAISFTLRDYGFDILNSVFIKPVRSQITAVVVPIRSSPWLSQEFMFARTLDGAITSGSVPPDAWAKFTLPKGLPGKDAKSLALENAPHLLDGFDGDIYAGYGKGVKSLLYRDTAIIKIGKKIFPGKLEYHFHDADVAGPHYDICIEGVPGGTPKFEVNIPNGAYKGRYAFNTTAKGMMVVPMKDRGLVLPKPAYNLKPEEFLAQVKAENDRAYGAWANKPGSGVSFERAKLPWIIEAKFDGSLSIASVHEGRVAFRSHRDTGETYYDRLPQLEFLENNSRFWTSRAIFPRPDVDGSVFKGELVHPDGAPRMSGILNALPHRARQIQSLRGPARFHVWDIVKFKGRDVSRRPYEERRALAEAAIRDIRLFNKHWDIVPKCPVDQDPSEFYQEMISKNLPYGEGVVVKDANAAHGEGTWYKIKARDFADFEVIEIQEGEGKYADTVGRFVVKNPVNGAIGEIGSFAITDTQRQWVWDNREELTGAIAKCLVLEVTERGVPRAGVFHAWHPDPRYGGIGSEYALKLYAESLAGGDAKLSKETVYALKTSAGWHHS